MHFPTAIISDRSREKLEVYVTILMVQVHNRSQGKCEETANAHISVSLKFTSVMIQLVVDDSQKMVKTESKEQKVFPESTNITSDSNAAENESIETESTGHNEGISRTRSQLSCLDGGGNGLTKTSLITHLRDQHCSGEAQAITKHSLVTDLVIFERAEGSDFMSPPDSGDGVVRFVLYDLIRPQVPSCFEQLHHVLKGALNKVICKPDDMSCWDEIIVNAIRSWNVPGGSLQLVREVLAESSPPLLDVDEEDLDLGERNIKQCKRKIYDGHYTAAVRVLSVVLDRIKSFPRGTSCGRDVLRTPLTPLVKMGGSIRLIAVGTIWRRLVSKVGVVMIGHSLDGYLDDLQFGVGVSGRGEAILHFVNRLIEDRGDDVGLSMLLVDFKNAFNLVDREAMLQEVRLRCPAISRWGDPLGPLLFALVLHQLICKIRDSFSLCLQAWYLDDGTIVGDTLVVGKDDLRSRLEGVFARSLHGVKLLGRPASVDFNFSSELVMKRVAKTIGLIDAIAKINDPQGELLLLRACTSISKLYFAMRTCSPRVFEMAQRSFDATLCCALERIVTASGPGFGDWQWRLATLPFAFRGLGVYAAGDVLNYAFNASRLQSASLQTKLLRHSGIVASRPTFDDAFCVFNTKMKTDLLSNPSEITAPKLVKKLADICFTHVTQTAESTFSLSPRQMALRQSQMEDHTSDRLRVVPISGLG
ncbi:hypothetical protein Tco_0918753 [Tanacetum coccineum]